MTTIDTLLHIVAEVGYKWTTKITLVTPDEAAVRIKIPGQGTYTLTLKEVEP